MSMVAELPKLHYDKRLNRVLSCWSGTSITIAVNITGCQDPTVEWFFNEEPLSSTGVQAVVETYAWRTRLTLFSLRPGEDGLYKVKVTNKAGANTATFEVEVKGPYTKSMAVVLRSWNLGLGL